MYKPGYGYRARREGKSKISHFEGRKQAVNLDSVSHKIATQDIKRYLKKKSPTRFTNQLGNLEDGNGVLIMSEIYTCYFTAAVIAYN